MTREEMIEVIVADLPQFKKRDPDAFWQHVEELERNYLRAKSVAELKGIYEEVKD